jgi:hypothetical protein
MTKLFVATPMYGGQCFGFYTQSVIALTKTMHGRMDVVFSFMFNESLIPRARNGLANQFLKDESATHLLFIDADIRFEADDVLKLLDADKDVICGIYPKKEINWHTVRHAISNDVATDQLKFYTGAHVVNLVNYDGQVVVPMNEPVEIWNGGTGMMLIKREVFEKLSDHVPTYINDILDTAGTMKQEPIREFFATSIEDGTRRLLSEDYHFCNKWREIGGKVYAAPWMRLAHCGTYIFEGQLLPAP